MRQATDGSIADRALVNPDRNNFGPRLGFAWTVTPGTVVRGGYGVSYTHFNRAGGGNLLPINGPQVINAVVNQTPADAAFRPTEAGYPAGLTDPTQFNPLAANITYMPEDFHSSPVQSWYVSAQREFGPRLSRRRRLRWQPRRRPAALRQLQPGGTQQRGRDVVAPVAPADSRLRRHHLRLQRRQVALQGDSDESRMAAPFRADAIDAR